jgi:hypothetical protein
MLVGAAHFSVARAVRARRLSGIFRAHTTAGAVPPANREPAAAVEESFPGLFAVQALQDYLLTVDEADAHATQLSFSHVAHIHFVQTYTVEDSHRGTFLGAEPPSFQIAPGSAGVKPRRLGVGSGWVCGCHEGAVVSRLAWK